MFFEIKGFATFSSEKRGVSFQPLKENIYEKLHISNTRHESSHQKLHIFFRGSRCKCVSPTIHGTKEGILVPDMICDMQAFGIISKYVLEIEVSHANIYPTRTLERE